VATIATTVDEQHDEDQHSHDGYDDRHYLYPSWNAGSRFVFVRRGVVVAGFAGAGSVSHVRVLSSSSLGPAGWAGRLLAGGLQGCPGHRQPVASADLLEAVGVHRP
jgi:hypothetical protein